MSHKPFVCIAVCSLITLSSAQAQERQVACGDCHTDQHQQLTESVHNALGCQQCHGGAVSYKLSAEESRRYMPSQAGGRPTFDHGASFTGPAPRADIPQLCGDCHADVAKMNVFGMRTDQLAAYWTSGHGRALKERGEERVAVCSDCHGTHDILRPTEPTSKTNPMNVPATCAACHGDAELMAEFDLPVEIIDEYRHSVHGRLLLDQGDTGSPTCVTCHGNHAAAPPGFANVGTVCGQCHQHAAKNFAESIHATQEGFNGCVQCHGGGPDSHGHAIDRITRPAGILIERYAHLLASDPLPLPADIANAIHPVPKQIMEHNLSSCTDCHEDIDEDESLPKLFDLLDEIAKAEQKYVETAAHLEKVGQGVLLVDKQRFEFEEAKTHLISLAPLQHTLDNDRVAEEVGKLNAVCDQVQAELTDLESGLDMRYWMLIPIWVFSMLFAVVLYAKYKVLKAEYVTPLPK